MKYILVGIFIVAIFTTMFPTLKNLFADKSEMQQIQATDAAKGSFYDFKMPALSGEVIDFAQYKGKKVVVINTASKCGYTPQYKDWQTFHEKYGDKVVVLGFPANNFLRQEPGSNDEIGAFCQKNYGVTFQLFEKIDVIGKNQHPLYKWLSSKELNGWNDKAPTWNFCKYVIDEEGKVTNFFGSKILPTNPEFLQAVGMK